MQRAECDGELYLETRLGFGGNVGGRKRRRKGSNIASLGRGDLHHLRCLHSLSDRHCLSCISLHLVLGSLTPHVPAPLLSDLAQRWLSQLRGW